MEQSPGSNSFEGYWAISSKRGRLTKLRNVELKPQAGSIGLACSGNRSVAPFVTGGSVNPTSTIGALALRWADRIVARDDVRGRAHI